MPTRELLHPSLPLPEVPKRNWSSVSLGSVNRAINLATNSNAPSSPSASTGDSAATTELAAICALLDELSSDALRTVVNGYELSGRPEAGVWTNLHLEYEGVLYAVSSGQLTQVTGLRFLVMWQAVTETVSVRGATCKGRQHHHESSWEPSSWDQFLLSLQESKKLQQEPPRKRPRVLGSG